MNPRKPARNFSMPRHVDHEKMREIDRQRMAYYASLQTHSVEAVPDVATSKNEVPAPAPERPRATAEAPEQRAAVEIPGDWRDLSWPRLRSLASKVCDDPISNRPVAVAAIEAELARRNSK